MKKCSIKKNVIFIVIILVITAYMGFIPDAAEDATVFKYDFSNIITEDMYSDWFCSDWSNVNTGGGKLESSSVMLRRNTYVNYSMSFKIICPKGSHTGFSKVYSALRQPEGYMIDGDLLAFNKNDLGNDNKSSRPGNIGILIGMANAEIDIVVHTLDDKGNIGNVNVRVPLPDGMNFKDGAEIEIRDSKSSIEILAKGSLAGKINLENTKEYTKCGYKNNVYTNAVVYDASGNELIRTEKALVPEMGSVGFLSRNGFYYIETLKMSSLSGKAADAVVKNADFDKNSVLITPAPDAPVMQVKEISNKLSTTEICILIMANAVLIGCAVLIFFAAKNSTVKITGAVLLTAAVIIIDVLMLTGKKPVADLTVSTEYTLDASGNTVPLVITSANQTALDALGRKLPSYEEVGDPKAGKYVGIFYTLWTMSVTTITDNTKQLARDPVNTKYGAPASFHWWGEPEVGYATSTDEWVVRRNLYYLTLAGIDYIYLDFTNAGVYEEAFDVLLETSLKMREEGTRTPYIVPWVYADDSGYYRDIGYLYRTYYSKEQYKSLWFYMDGKPLAMLKRVEESRAEYTSPKTYFPVLNNKEISDFFTFRFAWVPNESDDGHLPGEPVYKWSWGNPLFMHKYKEGVYAYGYDEKKGAAEQVTIIVGGDSNPGAGRSHEQGTLDKFNEKETSGQGIYFQEQFDWVMENHPEVEYLNISGWNEWIAQYFPEFIGTVSHCPFGFVDAYNREFSRDIEPMKGGYTDNYFYQLCSIVRRFKGMEAPEEQKNNIKIDVSESFDQWKSAGGSYKDYMGDTAWRNSSDPTGTYIYVNETGRNDIIESKIAYDVGSVYFYVRTADVMTPYTDKNWMLLFIDTDGDMATGWEGYDYLINFEVINESVTTLCKYQNGVWQEIGLVNYRQSGNEMHIAVPRILIGQTQDKISLAFKWTDNITDIYDLNDWFLTGDCAPERRNRYIFSAYCKYSESEAHVLTPRTDGAIQYMKAIDKAELEKDGSLKNGLKVRKFRLTTDYGKQPEINLLEGTGGNLVYETVADRVEIVTNNKPLDAFALAFDGYIDISDDGAVDFKLTADDGAVLYIDGRKVIDISGKHTALTGSGSLPLAKGLHSIRIEYFENGNGGSELIFSCSDQNSVFLH